MRIEYVQIGTASLQTEKPDRQHRAVQCENQQPRPADTNTLLLGWRSASGRGETGATRCARGVEAREQWRWGAGRKNERRVNVAMKTAVCESHFQHRLRGSRPRANFVGDLGRLLLSSVFFPTQRDSCLRGARAIRVVVLVAQLQVDLGEAVEAEGAEAE